MSLTGGWSVLCRPACLAASYASVRVESSFIGGKRRHFHGYAGLPAWVRFLDFFHEVNGPDNNRALPCWQDVCLRVGGQKVKFSIFANCTAIS
eukprot:626869-Pelagomonas_calceolata.AAC.1